MSSSSSLLTAADSKHVDLLKRLLKEKADSDKSFMKAIHESFEDMQNEIYKLRNALVEKDKALHEMRTESRVCQEMSSGIIKQMVAVREMIQKRRNKPGKRRREAAKNRLLRESQESHATDTSSGENLNTFLSEHPFNGRDSE